MQFVPSDMVQLTITECPALKWYQRAFLTQLLGQEHIAVSFGELNTIVLESEEHDVQFMRCEFNLAYFYRVQIAPLSYVDAWLQHSI